MAATYCYEGIPLRFLVSLFLIQMRYLVYMRYSIYVHTVQINLQTSTAIKVLKSRIVPVYFLNVVYEVTSDWEAA